MAALTKAQRVWLNELGSMVAAPPEVEEGEGESRDDGDDEGRSRRSGGRSSRREGADDPIPTARLERLDPRDAPDPEPRRRDRGEDEDELSPSIPRFRRAVGGDQPEDDAGGDGPVGVRKGILPGIPGIPGLPIDPSDIAKTVAGPLFASCQIQNNTGRTLQVDRASLQEVGDDSGKVMGISHGEYTSFPKSSIPPNSPSDFSAVNKKKTIPILGELSATGIEGYVRYFIDEQKTAWVVHFNNPRVGKNTSKGPRLEGPNANLYETPPAAIAGNDKAAFLWELNLKGGTPPVTPPGQPPAPGAAADIQASCQISVINETAFELVRADADHEFGDFMVPPPRTVAPNSVSTFVSVETPGAKEEGCKGFVLYEVQAPTPTSWRVEWLNPEGARNVSSSSLTPPVPGLRSQDVIGQGEENVPVSFTLSGGPAGPAPVVPPPVVPPPGVLPPPPTEVPFTPPVEAKQPTLRKGDKSEDEWVEYAQLLLNFHLGTSLPRSGSFDAAMHSAVLKFQQKEKLLVDGVIGNQTWAALREGAPEKPSTDGRQPHTHVEHGVEARWTVESDKNARYTAASDELVLLVESVGDTKLDPGTLATVQVTPPGGAARAVNVPLGPPVPGKSREGMLHKVTLKPFRATFPSVPPGAPASAYRIDAYLPQDLGGDRFTGGVTEV